MRGTIVPRVARVGIYAFLLGAALFFLLPLYVMLVTSFKPMEEIRLEVWIWNSASQRKLQRTECGQIV